MKPYPLSSASAAVLLFFWFGVIGATEANAQAKFGDMVGLNVKFLQGEPQENIKELPELGVRWVRDAVLWRNMEPRPGVYNKFPADFEERLKFYKAHNIGICFPLVFANGDAYPATEKNPLNPINAPAYGRYAAQIARMLKASGVKFVLEVWNEPHNFIILKMAGGEWNGRPPSPWVDHYVAMVNEAVCQVKAIDPKIKLMTDEDVWMNHYQFLAKGLSPALDGFGIHPYWNKNSSGPEDTGISANTSWALPFQLTDEDRSLVSAITRLKKEGQRKMNRTPLIWATEVGSPIGATVAVSPINPDGVVTEEAVAAYLLRSMITLAASGVETVYWFSSWDGPDGYYGLCTNDGTRRKAFEAFKVMTSQLGEMTYAAHVIGKDHRTTGVQAHGFTSRAGNKTVLWNIDGEGVFVGPRVSNYTPIRITDLMGQNIPVKLNRDGYLLLTLSESPVYVTGLQAAFTLTRAR